MTQNPAPQITPNDMARVTAWHTEGWEAEYYSPHLVITNPQGEVGLVVLKSGGRNVTLNQFRDSVRTHGVLRACEVFWKLRANQ